MTNLMQKFEKQKIEKLTSKKGIPTFRPGDTLKVSLKISEGDRSRLQAFEGVCIARKNNSINSKFTVRRIAYGEGVERVFPLFSPIIEKIEVVRKGDVNRAKLYYLRDRTGKRARIAEHDRGEESDQYLMTEVQDIKSEESIINSEVYTESENAAVDNIKKEKENKAVE